MNKEIIITANSYNHAAELININSKHLKAIVVGCNIFSDCINSKLSISQIQKLLVLAHKNKTKVYVLLDCFIYENEIKDLEKLIVDLAKIKIDGIIFNDFAINQICFEKKINVKLIYSSKTLTTNYCQFEFYLNNKINSVILPNELSLNEVIEMGKNCKCKNKTLQIIKQVSGYSMIMISRWSLIKNFCDKENINYMNIKDKKLWIKENTRNFPAIISENKYGTHIYSGFVISCLKFINDFIKNKINTFYIDSFLKDDQWTIDILKLYSQLLDNLKNKLLLKKLIIKEQEINKPDKTSISFLGNKDDLLYLPKENDNEKK